MMKSTPELLAAALVGALAFTTTVHAQTAPDAAEATDLAQQLQNPIADLIGCQLTRNIFAEAGYRALGVDYEQDGLTYNTITHGAQVTMGINF